MRLIDLWGEPNAKPLMLFSGLLFKCKKLMSSPETPDDTRALAGSLITLLTDVPVTSETSDEKSGSYGHVNIVVPRPARVYGADKEILELEGGAAPAEFSDACPCGVIVSGVPECVVSRVFLVYRVNCARTQSTNMCKTNQAVSSGFKRRTRSM